ncbi:Tex family protein [Thermincola ferriacetica]
MIETIARELKLKAVQVENTVKLLDAGNTVPFIARYRKEATGELDENQIREIQERLNYLRNLEERKQEVIRLIDEQGKLTPELAEAINRAEKLQEVEDLYRPYKQKRKTRASVAKEKGLEPLAEVILAQAPDSGDLSSLATSYVNAEMGVNTPEEALEGARDIIAEIISDDADVRKLVRRMTFEAGFISSQGKTNEKGVYQMYYDYREPVQKIPPHRILALNRGEKEEALNVKIEAPAEKILVAVQAMYIRENSPYEDFLKNTVEDSYKRLIEPSIEREIRNELTQKGEEQAVKIFASNLRNLLLQPPIKGKVVMGIDPGYRTGCKIAVVDETGKVLDVGVMYPTPPQNKVEEAKKIMASLIDKHKVDLIAIGNGTASRETEAVVADLLAEYPGNLAYTIVSEAGASVYSASRLAGEEFPQYDLSLRSAVSIARRLQDPLAELVKIDPKAVGVGQYQHDVNSKRLEATLQGVVESCVNTVGVDLNTASPSLLKYVAGIKPSVAKNIVAYRENNGKFRNRAELKKVKGLGEQTFIQCAGFLRITDGDNPLEKTPVHPESYFLAEKILAKVGLKPADLLSKESGQLQELLSKMDAAALARELNAGEPTVRDIIEALQKPGRDPREDMPKPIFHKEVTSLENLREGMVLQGTVRNVVDFGAFVDIGVKHDGLVHISQLSEKYVKHPMEVVAVGDIVKVKVVGIDLERERVSLSMKDV